MEIIELERLCHNEDVCRAAHMAGNALMEKGFLPWSAASWDEPAVAAIADGQCVAAVNYSINEKQLFAQVDFAFCSPEHPAALAALLLRLRKKLAARPEIKQVRFTMHFGNAPMEKLANKLKLTPHTLSYRVPVAA